MTSDKQREANRRNAKCSAGPRSATGKGRSSQNALRHGLSARLGGDPAHDQRVEALAEILTGPEGSPSHFVSSTHWRTFERPLADNGSTSAQTRRNRTQFRGTLTQN